jgi:predicted nucleic acid-binding protein
MIVVDSSVWIDYFNGRTTSETDALERFADRPIIIGDLIMAEVLPGFRREDDFRRAQRIFAALEFRAVGGREIAIAAARNYRFLRENGVTVRTTIDTLIATFCIAEGHELLHSDRDFDPFERHLGLRVIKA